MNEGNRGLGIEGLVPAVFTPMDQSGGIAVDRIPGYVDRLVEAGVAALYVCGTTGEGALLTTQERRAVAEAFVASADERLPVIVHVGHASVRESRALAAHAGAIGADALAALPPTYLKPLTIEDLVPTLAEIARAADELPFYYYHIPSMSGCPFDMLSLLEQAAPRIPTLAGMKFTDERLDQFLLCLRHDGGRFEILFGRDEMLLGGLVLGARGAVGSTYSFAAPLYRRIIETFARGDLGEARRVQAIAAAMLRVLARHGGQTAFKATMEIVGCDCGPNRLPRRSLDADAREALRRDLDVIGVFDLI